MRKLEINLQNNNYQIVIEKNIIDHLSFYLNEVYKENKLFIITDDNVEKLYLNRVKQGLSSYEVDWVVIPHGEESKSLEMYQYVCQTLLDKNIRRNHLLIALGGGVVGDLTGFVAATLFRGIPYVGIPTTLLSQMDSSIGGKTGIDFCGRKNILGAFKQPLMVLIDPEVLMTLDEKEFNNGMGELIKHSIIGNKNLFNLLKERPQIDEDIIYESLIVKKYYVEKDEFDQNERMILNFGHTFGHVIEMECDYKHGECVAIGMLMAIKLGIDLGLTNNDCYDMVKNLLVLYNLPTKYYDYKKYLDKILGDKKNLAGNLRLILIKDFEEPFIHNINEKDVKESLI